MRKLIAWLKSLRKSINYKLCRSRYNELNLDEFNTPTDGYMDNSEFDYGHGGDVIYFKEENGTEETKD